MRLAITLILLYSVLASQAHTAEPVANPKLLTPILAKTLAAYNQDNAKAFYAAWTNTDVKVGTQEIYNTFYKDKAKKELGNYKPASLKLIDDKNNQLQGKFATLYYQATFGKDVPGLITINFMYEDGRYKIMYLELRKQP